MTRPRARRGASARSPLSATLPTLSALSVAAAAALAAFGALPGASARSAAAQDQGAMLRPEAVTASRYKFDPPRIEVRQDDLVRIELKTSDIAHSFTIDAYRIAKRVSPGRPVTFEFRADKVGTFPFYCNLQIDDGCRQMRGELVVRAKK
jgi:heme/copper-type cytochrome/quinol oxidase subunit 2